MDESKQKQTHTRTGEKNEPVPVSALYFVNNSDSPFSIFFNQMDRVAVIKQRFADKHIKASTEWLEG